MATALVLVLTADLTRPPDRQVTARLAVWAIHLYQRHLSARLGQQCRFTPTCSQYAIVSIERHGLMVGGWYAARRVVRCGPWTPAGTVDPPR